MKWENITNHPCHSHTFFASHLRTLRLNSLNINSDQILAIFRQKSHRSTKEREICSQQAGNREKYLQNNTAKSYYTQQGITKSSMFNIN